LLNFNYKCSQCSASYEIVPELMLCPECSSTHKSGQPLNGVLEVELSGTLESNDPLDFLPVEGQYFPAIPVGNTPLWQPENLQKKYGFPELYLKDDGVNPTGSLKDRASFLVAAFARKHGIREVVVLLPATPDLQWPVSVLRPDLRLSSFYQKQHLRRK